MTKTHSFEIDFGLDLLKMDRLTPAGQRILDTASHLFYWYGIHKIGVERIARDADVTKKTIFDRFKSKDLLTAAYLQRRDLMWRTRIRTAIDALPDNSSAKAMILASFDALDGWVADENPRGCAFVNALAEITSPDHPGFKIIRSQKLWLIGFYEQLARYAGLERSHQVSEQLMILYEGALVANSADVFQSPVKTARTIAAQILGRDTQEILQIRRDELD